MLLSRDGVPITHIIRGAGPTTEAADRPIDSAEDLSAFAGMAAGVLAEIRRTVDPMSWDEPQRVVMRATRGTLILLVTARATISVELDRGMAAEELRLPMEAVVARLSRAMGRTQESGAARAQGFGNESPPGLFPAREETHGNSPEIQSQAGNEVPNTTTES